MTYSILARDPETGQIGYGCQSHFFGVGRLVGWLESGLGGVATQAFVNVGFGPRGLDSLRAGSSAGETVAALVASDELSAYRQVAVVDASGGVASFTGSMCVPSSGSRKGDQVVAQGNMLASDLVYESMIDAYDASTDSFPERLLAGLRAAEANGGDARGSQSAVLRVVSGTVSDTPWEEVVMDVRVDDHTDPIEELARLVALDAAYVSLGGVLFAPRVMIGAFENVSDSELADAFRAIQDARVVLGDNLEAAFWQAVLLARSGQKAEAEALFAEIFVGGPHWRPYLDAIATVGFLDVSQLDLV
ncbi:hypothetical protein BH09ACT1_BH09ACT1_15910 [soil metagenome]